MLEIEITEAIGVECEALARRIENFGGTVRLTMRVEDLYQASSLRDIAYNWLKSWYIAESLAASSTAATCKWSGDKRGIGTFIFELVPEDVVEFSEELIAFASVFDEDDLESRALIYDEAEGWLENRGDTPAWFPELEQNYRSELGRAVEHEAEYPEDEDDFRE